MKTMKAIIFLLADIIGWLFIGVGLFDFDNPFNGGEDYV